MDVDRIPAEQIARAAAQGVAIALSARNFSGDLEARGPIVMGNFPEELFQVSLERDASGGFVVKSIQPYRSAGSA